MKKQVLLFLVLCTAQFAFAQYYKAEITLNGGTVKSGFAEPVNTEKSNINFKETLDGKKEKLDLKNLEMVHYYDEKSGKEMIAEKLNATQGNYSTPAFLYLIYKGEVSVYAQTSDFYDQSAFNNTSIKRSEDTSFFFRYKDEKKATLITMKFEGGLVVPIGLKSFTKKGINDFFKDKCPQLVSAFDNGEIKFKKDVFVFIDYYEKKCKK